jgi:hypothetical protein
MAAEQANSNPQPAFMNLCRSGDLHKIEKMVENYEIPSVNFCEPVIRDTPLHLAARNGHTKVVEYLLKHGANVKARTRGGLLAVQQPNVKDEIKKLLGDPFPPVEQIESEFFEACKSGNEKTVLELLESGIDPNCSEPYNYETALHMACRKGKFDVAILLLGFGAEPQQQDIKRCTPLQKAMTYAQANPMEGGALKVFLEKGIFSSSLEFHMKIQRAKFPHLRVPYIVYRLITSLHELRDKWQEGLFRVAPEKSESLKLKTFFSRPGEFNQLPAYCDANIIGSVLKDYLRSLPEPLISIALYHKILNLLNRPEQIRQLLQSSLNPDSFALLASICIFLSSMKDKEEKTKMTSYNLSVVFSPNVIDTNLMIPDVEMLKALIDNSHIIFQQEHVKPSFGMSE